MGRGVDVLTETVIRCPRHEVAPFTSAAVRRANRADRAQLRSVLEQR